MSRLTHLGQDLRAQKPLRWFLAALLGALLGIAAGRNLTGSVSIVDGDSMVPTYESGARVFVTPIKGSLRRGEIVLVDDQRGEYALKRIVGMPGETVHLWRGYVFVNRKMLIEPYLPKHTLTFPSQQTERNRYDLGVDEYFVLGDNRLYSIDSRAYGPVPAARLKGRVPTPANMMKPHFAPYVLPEPGKSAIRSADQALAGGLQVPSPQGSDGFAASE